MNVSYCGPLKDYSGYGECSRHHVAALDAAGVNVYAKLVSYVHDAADFGELGNLVAKMANNPLDYKIKLLHTTPDQFPKYIERGKYHIGFMYWETDKVPPDFANGLQLCDEIWTGSEANVAAIERAGVTKPVIVIPQSIQTERERVAKYKLKGFDGFLFYSIFEWTARKNPAMLIEAYCREFKKKENVGLLIKTYFKDFTQTNKDMITHRVKRLKAQFDGQHPIFLYKELMDRKQIERLHQTGDCFVLPHHGEGWGLPIAEAMLAGNTAITTGYGGVNEYIGKHAHLLPYTMEPVQDMGHSRWYGDDQNWAQPDVEHLRGLMRATYENRKNNDNFRRDASKFIKDTFNFNVVGAQMAGRLKEIEATI